jgi:RHS repeat-associated protein
LRTATINSYSVLDYYSFGSVLDNRNYNSPNYRYGFNGKEKDDEVEGAGNEYDYGARINDPRLGRFMSVDPITGKYPELSPYQFASNRPIDGIDLDGLEYATFNIYVNKSTRTVTSIPPPLTDYGLKNKGTKGPGIQYNIFDAGTGKLLSSDFQKNAHGIYQGSNNPQLPNVGGNLNDLHDDYTLEPVDQTDKIAKQHDKDFDEQHISGLTGVLDSRSTDANVKYIEEASKVVEKYKTKAEDDVTHKPVTEETKNAAVEGINGFRVAENLKEAVYGTKPPTLGKPNREIAPADKSKTSAPKAKPKSVPSY